MQKLKREIGNELVKGFIRELWFHACLLVGLELIIPPLRTEVEGVGLPS